MLQVAAVQLFASLPRARGWCGDMLIDVWSTSLLRRFKLAFAARLSPSSVSHCISTAEAATLSINYDT